MESQRLSTTRSGRTAYSHRPQRQPSGEGKAGMAFELEFYEDKAGNRPVYRWITEGLSPVLQRLLGAAMRATLQKDGIGVCETEFGKQLGGGLFEFRLNADPQPIIDEERRRQGKKPKKIDPPVEKVLLRVFCHAHGDRLILLLGAYDKAQDDSKRRQETEIEIARARLRQWKLGRVKDVKARKKQRKGRPK